ncbi:MAG: hypothetical protein IPH20_03265 [Bacteroidales bacterium]|nr:hypothetical protein [Bacteroidales bacterium]
MARIAPERVNHLRNTCLFFAKDLKATSPRINANNTIVRIVPNAKADIYIIESILEGRANDGNNAKRWLNPAKPWKIPIDKAVKAFCFTF